MKKLILFVGLTLRLSCSIGQTFAQITPTQDIPIQGDIPVNSEQNSYQTSGGSSVRKNPNTINPYAHQRREEGARSQPLPSERA